MLLPYFFKLPCIYGVIYWGYAVENIVRGADDWHSYCVTVSSDGTGTILTPVITYANAQPLGSSTLHERGHQLYVIFVTSALGSESCPSSTDIFGLRVSHSEPPRLSLFHVSQSLKTRRSAKCTNAANSGFSNFVIFRRKPPHSGFTLFPYLYHKASKWII
jgi:hypothetical protein